MRVLIVHNRYRESGGEDAVFEAEAALLARHGHAVARLEFSNDDIPDARTPLGSLRLAIDTVWSRGAAARVREAVRAARAEVVHFHNTFPLISPAAYGVCREEGAVVIQTIHNYRLLCPNALFFRDGHVCEDCLGRTPPWPGVAHGCYRDSRPQSAAAAAMLTAHRLRRTWARDVDLFIALNDFSRRKLIEGGLPEAKIAVKPNFLPDDPGPRAVINGGYFFAGRLTPDKGIPTLLEAFQEPLPPLAIAGAGPLQGVVAAAAASSPRIRYLGRLPRAEVLTRMQAARALIFPSVWYETFGLTIVEAFACGLPVIASNLGTMAEIIEDGETGLLFRPGDAADLAAKVRWAEAHPEELRRLGDAARRVFLDRFTAEQNYRRLVEIYALARLRRRLGPHPPTPSPNPGRGGDDDLAADATRSGEGAVSRTWQNAPRSGSQTPRLPLSQDWERGLGGEGDARSRDSAERNGSGSSPAT